MSNEIKRYFMDGGTGYNAGLVFDIESEDGGWVRYEDHVKALAEEKERHEEYGKNRFCQGYACACACMIQMDKGVHTQTREMFHAGLGDYDLKKLRKWGIDEHDLEIFKQYRDDLKIKPPKNY